MYVTRRLSEYQRNRSELKQPLPEGPNSGVLIIQDEESKPTCCFGSCYGSELKGLPFPQNAKLTVNYIIAANNTTIVYQDPVVFIPVLDQPLSSNRYYAIKRSGKHSGEASANAKEEDRVPCCFCFTRVPEAKPQQADPYDIYQQFEIHQRKSLSRYYFATSVAPDGVPPEFLKRKGWTVEYSTSEDYGLRDDAKGINAKLRSELPSDLNISVAVGNWYVPFIFVKDGDAKDQLKSSTYYRMTLYQKWEEVYSCENADKENREVVLNMEVDPEVVKLEGQLIGKETIRVDENGVVWFGVANKSVGLRSVVTARMKWEEERFGWKSKAVSFVLRRMDESLVLTFEFKHADKLKSKWES
ncbi:BnaA09g46240D [Brassica napus]|uniref:BnaA09g46240D protein n=1 Tax=Brassica napus TaxID=3708 RepID=A0A078GPS9_BRANA|nr:BnaA09g46240D [Brassica napus]